MAIECPVCGSQLTVGKDVIVGELMDCGECGTALEVSSLDPVTVAEAPTEEEDWGQ